MGIAPAPARQRGAGSPRFGAICGGSARSGDPGAAWSARVRMALGVAARLSLPLCLAWLGLALLPVPLLKPPRNRLSAVLCPGVAPCVQPQRQHAGIRVKGALGFVPVCLCAWVCVGGASSPHTQPHERESTRLPFHPLHTHTRTHADKTPRTCHPQDCSCIIWRVDPSGTHACHFPHTYTHTHKQPHTQDCSCIIWRVGPGGTCSPLYSLTGHGGPVLYCAWSPDDTKLLTVGLGAA